MPRSERAVICGDRKDYDPETEGVIAQSMNDVGRDEDSHQDIHAQGKPAGPDVAQNLAFWNFMSPAASAR